MIYFDYASTTPLNPEVLSTYMRVLEQYYANSDSLHELGTEVADLMEKSRANIAKLLGVENDELVFTSGASEANNLFIKGVAFKQMHRGKHLITSIVEHSSVYETFKELESVFGFEVSYLPVNKQGIVELEVLKKAIRKDTILVSIMAINNEMGSILPISDYADVVHEQSRAYFHSDCTQMLGKYPIDLNCLDGASFSAHKIFGNKGSGLLYVKKNVALVPLINGGQQEKGIRGGTSNAPINITLSKTIRLALSSRVEHTEKVTKIRQYLIDELIKSDEFVINSPSEGSAYILNIACKQMTSEVLLNALDAHHIYVSARSTCSSKSNAPSRVLSAMGLSSELANRSIRLSFSHLNTIEEAMLFMKTIKEILNDYRIKG